MSNFYAVACGRKPGIYQTWDECKEQVHGFPAARHKKFSSKSEAEAFIKKFSSKSEGEAFSKKNSSSTNSSTLAMSSSRVSATSGKFTSVKSGALRNFFTPGNGSRKRSLPDKGSEALAKVARIQVDATAIVVYTDGACTANGQKHASAGVGVFWGDNHPDNVSEPLMPGQQTNNRAEYQAVVRALEIAHLRKYPLLQVRTDSNLLVRSMNEWMKNWKKKNWVTAGGTPVKNRDLLEKIDELRQKVKAEFVHVDGHAGVYGNEKADELARAGVARNR